MEQHNRNEKTPWCDTGKPLVLCGNPPSPMLKCPASYAKGPCVPLKKGFGRERANKRYAYGIPVYFRISKAAAQTARLLKFAGKLPNMTAMVREIIRGDYLRLSEEWKREQAKKRAEEAKAKGGAE